jgi:hypothetical protein
MTNYLTTSGTGGIEDISFTAVKARYVRMYGTQRGTTGGYSLSEFGIYGQPNATNVNFQPFNYTTNLNAIVVQSNNSLRLSWPAKAQQSYGLQFATNIVAPDWIDYEPQVLATNATAGISFPTTNQSQIFFRIKPAF